MKIHALSTGYVQIKPSQIRAKTTSRFSRLASTFSEPAWTEKLPIYCYVIEHPEGIIVVDTGDSHARPAGIPHPFHALAAKIHVQPEEEIGAQLERLGISPKDVRVVVLTHLHIDHDGGIKDFPNSRIIVAQQEYAQARGLMGRLNRYTPQRWNPNWKPEFTNFEPLQFGSFDQHQRITKAGDVMIVPTPGHTSSHQSVIVRDGDLHHFLAGDTSYTQEGMLEQWIDGVGPSGSEQQATHRKIQAFAKERPTIYLPAHDPQAAQRLERQQTVV